MIKKTSDWIFRFLLGDDIFISYSRADGATYAAGLASKLADSGYSCKLDQWGTEATAEMPESLKKSLRRSAVLVLVGTVGAAKSDHVNEEIISFKKTKRMIVPIVFDGVLLANDFTCRDGKLIDKSQLSEEEANALTKAKWADEIIGLPISVEKVDALVSGTPTINAEYSGEGKSANSIEVEKEKIKQVVITDGIVSRVEKTFTFSRKDERLRKTSQFVSVVLLLLIIASGATFATAVIKGAEAAQKTIEAQEATRLADAAKEEAEKQQKVAKEAKTEADTAKAEAEEQKRIAGEEKTKADNATKLADEKNKLALQKTKLAEEKTKEAEQANAEAQIAKNEAEKQLKIANKLEERNKIEQGRKLALGAQVELKKSPNLGMRAVLLATEAIRLDHSVEADDALRQGLSLLPEPIVTLNEGLKIKKNSFDSTGNFAAALEVIMGDGSGGRFRLWSLNDWSLSNELSNQSGIIDYEFGPQNDYLALLNKKGQLNIYQLSTQKLISTELFLENADKIFFSPNGEVVAIAGTQSDTSIIKTLKITTNQQFPEINVPGLLMDSVFSNDGQLIATGSNDRYARVWQVFDGKELAFSFSHEKEGLVSYVRFMNNSNCLLTFATKIHTWSLNDNSDQSCFQTEYPGDSNLSDAFPQKILVSPTGKYIVRQNQESIIIEQWEGVGIGGKVLTIPFRNFDSVGFSHDESVFLTVGGDHTVRVWDINEKRERSRFSYDGDIVVYEVGPQMPIHSSSLSPDGKLFMVGAQNAKANSEVEEKNLLRVYTTDGFTTQSKLVFSEVSCCMAISSDSRFMASAGRDKDQPLRYVTNYSVRVGDIETGKEIGKLPIDTIVRSIAFSRDRDLIAIGTDDSKIRLWRWKEKEKNVEIITHDGSGDIQSLAFSPDGLYLASAGRDNTARLWRVSDGIQLAVMPHKDDTNHSVNRVEFDRDGKYLLTASGDHTAALWRMPDGKFIRSFKSNDWVFDARFSPDGKYIATASADGYARLWMTDSLKDEPISKMRHFRTFFSKEYNKVVNSLSFSPDGKFLATASGDWGGLLGSDMTQGDIVIWKIPGGVPLVKIPHPYTVWDTEFSPDGKYLASSSSDGKLRIWNAANGNELTRINPQYYLSGIRKVSFSKNGRVLVSPGEAYLWRSQDLIDLARSRVTRSLTQQERDEYFLRR